MMPATAQLLTIMKRVTECRDPKDNKFLELALNGVANVIVSGDQDLLMLNAFGGTPIVKPAAFVQMIRPNRESIWMPSIDFFGPGFVIVYLLKG
jgi:uncharacterized protein